jgi:hypothetical protein
MSFLGLQPGMTNAERHSRYKKWLHRQELIPDWYISLQHRMSLWWWRAVVQPLRHHREQALREANERLRDHAETGRLRYADPDDRYYTRERWRLEDARDELRKKLRITKDGDSYFL